MDADDTKYDKMIADDLGLQLSYFRILKKRMNTEDISHLFFYGGQYHFSKDDKTKAILDNIIKRNQRIDKLDRLI